MAEIASVIEGVREWLSGCPLLDIFSGGHIDWTDETAGNYGIMPTGCKNTRTVYDICGGVTRYKQYNVSIYARNWTIDDVVRLENTRFLDDFQEWVEDQQQRGLTPKFGDEPDEEEISAQNGMLFQLSEDGQTGLYQMQLAVTFVKRFERMM